MKRTARRPRPSAVAETPPPPLSPASPPYLFVVAVAAACIVAAASYVMYDTDLWQHLVVGKAIWTLHEVPRVNLWTWHHYGAPQITPSWGFRVLLWPLWEAGGVPAMFAWRWATTLAAFALLWSVARTLGARGLPTLVVLVWCAMVYRIRTDVRPETLAAVLFALDLWLLETSRAAARERGTFPRRLCVLVPVAWLWANVHISYYLGFLLIGIYLVDALLARVGDGIRRTPAMAPGRLALVAAIAAAISFAHPGGWRPLWQPFEFALFWRQDPMFRTIVELQPLMWRTFVRSGLPLLLFVWPALALLRARRTGIDRVELATCVVFTALAVSSQRFLGTYALVAAPFVARGVEHAITSWRRLPRPRRPWPGAALAAAACVAVALPECTRPALPLGLKIDPLSVPAAACDFMSRHGVRGRGFNHLHLGGYQIYRFWPERERMPMVSIHPEDTPPDLRAAFARVFGDPAAWEALDRRYHFDYVLLDHRQDPGDQLLDVLARDSTWTCVFWDDVADLLVRRGGALDSLARAYGYRVIPPGRLAGVMLDACATDSRLRAGAIAEAERALAGSRSNTFARRMLAILAMMENRFDDARRHLGTALEQAPRFRGTHELLGVMALAEDRPAEAIREFEAERRLHGPVPGIELRLGLAYRQTGDLGRARRHLEAELERHPDNKQARRALSGLDSQGSP